MNKGLSRIGEKLSETRQEFINSSIYLLYCFKARVWNQQPTICLQEGHCCRLSMPHSILNIDQKAKTQKLHCSFQYTMSVMELRCGSFMKYYTQPALCGALQNTGTRRLSPLWECRPCGRQDWLQHPAAQQKPIDKSRLNIFRWAGNTILKNYAFMDGTNPFFQVHLYVFIVTTHHLILFHVTILLVKSVLQKGHACEIR